MQMVRMIRKSAESTRLSSSQYCEFRKLPYYAGGDIRSTDVHVKGKDKFSQADKTC